MKIKYLILFICICHTLLNCQTNESHLDDITSDIQDKVIDSNVQNKINSSSLKIDSTKTQHSATNQTRSNNKHQSDVPLKYCWLDTYSDSMALIKQIILPNGYQRLPLKKGSFSHWLRNIPLHPSTKKVTLYNGKQKAYQAGAFRIINIDIGTRDLQQCADAVIRLKAEYHYSNKTYENIHFNYTSGANIRFSDWSKGKKPKLKNGKVYFTSPTGTVNTSYNNFKKYLTNVFCYAGSNSLSKELTKKNIPDIEPGDVFIWGGFPGHAIVVVDVAVHQKTGKKIFLLAQSYMPAQSIHIINNFNNSNLSPWYPEDFGEQLETPEWNFAHNSLKGF
ncbi:DUF4846 domain-containing protein [Aureispira]|nr:DUF4846 domain-containing protein [Aureispira sp.]